MKTRALDIRMSVIPSRRDRTNAWEMKKWKRYFLTCILVLFPAVCILFAYGTAEAIVLDEKYYPRNEAGKTGETAPVTDLSLQDKTVSDAALATYTDTMGTPKLVLFNFENFTENIKNNYLTKLISPNLSKELSKSKKFNIENQDILFASVKIDDYSNYMKLLRKTADTYKADYVITGFTHDVQGGTSVECLIYIERLNTMIKVNAQRPELGMYYKELVEELARKIEAELFKDMMQRVKESPGKGGQAGAAAPFKQTYFTIAGYFDMFYVAKWKTNAIPDILNKMLTFHMAWELASVKKVRTVKGARDLALFITLDFTKTRYNYLSPTGTVVSLAIFNIAGGVFGLMYKFRLGNYFTIDLSAGYGVAYSQTTLLANYEGPWNYIIPPTNELEKSWDHYINGNLTFNIIVNPHFLFSISCGYKAIIYTDTPLHMIAGQMGVGIKF